MPAEEIPPEEMQHIAKAGHWGGEKHEETVTPPDPSIHDAWWVGGGVKQVDVIAGAARAADNTNSRQQVHDHPHGTSCNGAMHYVIDPDPIRVAALKRY